MRALITSAGAGTPVLTDVELAPLGPADLRIRISAAAVNPIDVFWRPSAAGPCSACLAAPDWARTSPGWSSRPAPRSTGSPPRPGAERFVTELPGAAYDVVLDAAALQNDAIPALLVP
ncbi:hypothetical protein AB0J72_31895 [Dactylosporangium sp. NPDC049742]|uniref:hypothetical protein n=1 Tax=Dactylosporangium sp. NPDC049742 TaxID=3154737 RepID=UPI00342562DF